AQHEEERKAAEREALRLAAEREEINAAIADAAAAAQHGNYDFGVRLIEESASKFGMRSELAQAANQIKSARTADVTAHIETLIAEAAREADTNSFQAALNAIERAKTFIEFAAPAAGAKLKAAWKLFVSAYLDRKSTRLNSSHVAISYAVFCLT